MTSHLQVPLQLPRLPFSSPIGEEILSPTSPEDTRKPSLKDEVVDPFATPRLASRNQSSDAEGKLSNYRYNPATGRDGAAIRNKSTPENAAEPPPKSRGARGLGISVPERQLSVNKASRDRSNKHHVKEVGRSKRPGLNIITNFSKPPSTSVRLVDTTSTKSQQNLQGRGNNNGRSMTGGTQGRPTMPTQHRGFVSLADIKPSSSQPVPSDFDSIPAKTTERASEQDKEVVVDSTASAPDPVPITLGPSRPMEKDMGGNKDAERTLKNQDFAGLGFQLSDGFKTGTRVDHLRSESKDQGSWAGFSGISPSDRPIVIGISIPSTRLADYTLSPQSATPVSGHSNKVNPTTPTIVVTPAQKEVPWSSSPQDSKTFNARRSVSSIYSQPTPYVTTRGREEDVPPVPTLALGATCLEGPYEPLQSESYIMGKFGTSTVSQNGTERELATSFAMGDDNELQSVTRVRSLSGDSRLAIMGRASIDTVATRHRSRGWWNVITSPFIMRSSTIMTKRSPIELEKRAELPCLAQAATISGEQDRRDHSEQGFSPSVIYSADLRSGHNSIWTDMTEWEAQRGNTASVIDHSSSASRTGHKPQESSATIPIVMAGGVSGGGAADHSGACRHDRTITTPFHECNNHTCAPVVRQGPEGLPGCAPGARVVNNPFFQEPCDRFAAEFGQAVSPRARADSEATEIDEDDADLSPNVHEAVVAPVVRAPLPVPGPLRRTSQREVAEKLETIAILEVPEIRSRNSLSAPRNQVTHRATPLGPPAYSPPRRTTKFPRYVAVMPPGHETATRDQRSQIPGPMPQATALRGDILVSEAVPPSSVAEGQTRITNNGSSNRTGTDPATQITLADLEPPSQMQWKNEARRQEPDRDNAHTKKTTGLSRGRGCLRNRSCLTKRKPASRARRRCYFGLTVALIAMIILIIVLAITLTRKGDATPVQSQWLNITGFPPIPTGISTIAQPDAVNENSGCVLPASLWSCALPKEQQKSIVPNDPDQPNFRLEIRFRNGTTPANGTSKVKRTYRLKARSVLAGSSVGLQALRVRDAFTDALYSPSPEPPKVEDQLFLGNTTDRNTAPFEGESTPFFISFLSPSPVPSSRLLKRQDANGTSTSNSFPDLESAIPPPDVSPDGSAAAASLLPLPISQPLRIYNRGLPTEHYGFYTYFDRSIFLKSKALLNASSTTSGNVSDDKNGGSEKSGANVRCTWAQTRFLVQIWTNQGSMSPLLSRPNATTSIPSGPSSSTVANASNSSTSSANDFNRPGSFPYPVTITLDRHGGDITKKMIYCYAMDDNEHIVASQKKLQLEARDFGGILVNPAQGPFGHVNVSTAEGGPGGIDGGTGGCACQWKNFQSRH